MGVEGIWNHGPSGSQTATARAMESTTANSSSGTEEASISANDFLQLLVTEMKNQDPTAATDPNQYVNQLVQVNSLQQLISINQTLTADAKGPAKASTEVTHNVSVIRKGQTPDGPSAVSTTITSHSPYSLSEKSVPGNLAMPHANAAATRVALSLARH
jgi:flagellar basal-body rod modification protein FlgD